MADPSRAAGRSGLHVRKAVEADTDRIVEVLARAFRDDPVVSHIAQADERRGERIRRLMRTGLGLTLPHGETYVSEGLEGAALWVPPDAPRAGMLDDLRLIPDMIAIGGLGSLPRLALTLLLVQRKQPRAPHFHLQTLGVAPEHQGRGIGARLLAPVLERCDREGIPAYLRSSNPRNLPFYERQGFWITERLTLPGGGPRVWLMWREPA
jgi:ribosomal protein S18 acetylase RimI-like enzyme